MNSKLTREDLGDQFYVSPWLRSISQFFNQTLMCDCEGILLEVIQAHVQFTLSIKDYSR